MANKVQQSLTAKLPADAVDYYRRNGYYAPVAALAAAEAQECRRKLEAFEASQAGPLRGLYRSKPHLLCTWLADVVRHPCILDAVESIIGPNILVWTTAFFIKEAQDPSFVSWHQDSTYWGLSEPEVVSAWVAFTESTPLNGCLRVIPGTHMLDQVPHVDKFDAHNLLTRGQEIAVEVDEHKAVQIPLAPGEMSLHHIRLFHSSEPNRSNDRRIGLAIRYIPTRIKQTANTHDSATLVRGHDEHHHFELEPYPDGDFSRNAIEAHARYAGQRESLLYGGKKKQRAY